MSLREDKGVPFDISDRRRAEAALCRLGERLAMLREVTSDLIRASEPGELGRKTFEHVRSAFGAVVCTNYRLDPATQRLRLVFVHGIPPEHLKGAKSLELGQEYCGTAAASCQPLVADKQRIASDPNGGLVRELGATAYACYPLKASDGRLLGTFAVASATRESFTEDEVAWLGTITNFLAQAWERFEAEQGIRASEEAQARLAAIVTSSADAIVGKTLDGTVTTWNKAAERMFGYSASEMIGQSIRRLVPTDRQAEEDTILSRMARRESIERHEMMLVAKDGRTFDASITISPIRDAEGRNIGCSKIIRDISDRKQAAQALQASKDRLQLCLDAAQLGWWQYDPRRGVVSGDARYKEIFDLTTDEMPIEEIKKLVHPDDAERFWTDREVWLSSVDRKPHADEYRVRRRDGVVRWVEAHWLAYFGDASRERGFADVVGTAQDITERKEREEREHLLMREINHRAKNMLSVVDAIAHQTTTRTPEHFIERFSERIQALSANQDLLVRHAWHGVEIESLVCAQIAPFADLIGSRIVVRGPELRLNAASAQAIGLALHELTTNAGKYGALSRHEGHVYVCWEINSEIFTMSWTEREGPPVSAPERRGFGRIVMETMAERSVDGKVELDYAPSGLAWRLTCPAANAVEPLQT
jgi:PAS domain S-box-containing protein